MFDLLLGVLPNNHLHHGFLFPAASALFTKTAVSKSSNACMGSLTIGHEDDQGNLEYVTLRNQRSRYPNILRGYPMMRRSGNCYMETTGNCCWQLYKKRNFTGESQILFPGEPTFYPDFKPASIKKIECKLKWPWSIYINTFDSHLDHIKSHLYQCIIISNYLVMYVFIGFKWYALLNQY